MPYYDPETISDFVTAEGHQIWPFRANTEDPAGDPAHPNETADFLRDRIWAYCQDVITYVRSYHPTAEKGDKKRKEKRTKREGKREKRDRLRFRFYNLLILR